MKKFKVNLVQRMMMVQALNTWRGEISELRNISVAADMLSLSEKDRKAVDYVALGDAASLNQEKAEKLVVEIKLEDAQFDAMYNFLKNYKAWPPSIAIVSLFDILEKVKSEKTTTD